jgi:hypothetical protein
MTASHEMALETAAQESPGLLERFPSVLARAALAALLLALVTGAWLAFFWFIPFDFTPPRVR